MTTTAEKVSRAICLCYCGVEDPKTPSDSESKKQFRRMPLSEKCPVIHAVTLTTRFFASLRMTVDACGIGKGVLRGELKRAGDSSPYR